MNLAKVSANGQITVPIEIRRALGLHSGDKVLFIQNPDGEIVLSNASAAEEGETAPIYAGAVSMSKKAQ